MLSRASPPPPKKNCFFLSQVKLVCAIPTEHNLQLEQWTYHLQYYGLYDVFCLVTLQLTNFICGKAEKESSSAL
jgi:hypothetical protein